jgi:hypothetical protein
MSQSGVCPTCGRGLDTHDRHVRFALPDPVLDAPERDSTPGTWLSHADPRESVMMQVPGVGAFIRALLPVHLAGGGSVTFGVWLAVRPDDLQRLFRVWWQPEYRDAVVDGWLANAVPPWGLLASPVRATVLDPDHTPYCTSSDDVALSDVLSREWPDELVDAPGNR